MIKVNKGHLCIDGKNIELIQDFSHIVSELLSHNPEIVVATFSAYRVELAQGVIKCNPTFLKLVEKIIEEMKEERNNERH